VPSHRQQWISAVLALVILGAVSIMLTEAHSARPSAVRSMQPGTFAGYAFDACAAPSKAEMAAWRAHSPYRAIGVYIGGNHRGCAQPNLTVDWVRVQVAAGWHLIPLYVGPQASCTGAKRKRNLIDNAQAAPMGADAATDAVQQAAALGLIGSSAIVYDMEAYAPRDAACRAGVLAFLGAWSAKLHDLGYLSGFTAAWNRAAPTRSRTTRRPVTCGRTTSTSRGGTRWRR
jgi:hypothetical protein